MICVGLTAAHYSGLVFIFIDCEDRGPSQLVSSWALKLCFDSFQMHSFHILSVFLLTEHGPVDHEAVVSRATAHDQAMLA